ncbi:MAG TPA: hypothetical protein GXZ87_08275 [Bacteroidales bacterium]|nr:hypothetical protein [Bacteroidales bacterium]
MKSKQIFISIIITLIAIFVLPTGLNAAPPPWAPAQGYNEKTTHIFLPDQNMYYDLNTSEYIYEENGQWFKSLYVPEKFSYVDFRNAN